MKKQLKKIKCKKCKRVNEIPVIAISHKCYCGEVVYIKKDVILNFGDYEESTT